VTSADITPVRCAIYVRISKDDEGKEGAGLGVQRQEDDCRELASRLSWDVIEPVYSDNDISAFGGKKRPGYLALLDDIRSGAVDAVVCWHTDRLHRSTDELSAYIKACSPREVPTRTVKSGDLDLATSAGRMIAKILGAVAEQEVEHMIERMKAKKKQQRESGLSTGGRRPFGYRRIDQYRINPETGREYGKGHLEIDPDEADHMRRAYSMLLAGHSVLSIVRDLNAAGSRTTFGGKWDATTARRMMLRAANAGLIEHRTRYTAESYRQDCIVGPATWKEIVPEETWRAARALLTDPARQSSPGPRPAHLLTGEKVTRCGICGGGISAGIRRFKASETWYYVCRSGCTSRPKHDVDRLVTAAIIGLLAKPESVAVLRPSVDVTELNGARNGLRARLDELGAAFGAGHIDMQQMVAASKPLTAQLADVETRLGRAYDGSVLNELAGQPDAAERWFSLSLPRQREIAEALVRVKLLRAGRLGRPRTGAPFDPNTIRIEFTDLVTNEL
jgi:site-specific DNA recombinase